MSDSIDQIKSLAAEYKTIIASATPAASKYFTHSKAGEVKLAKGANARALTADAENLLKAILAASGVFSTTYTSTLRTYDDQARILLQKTAAQVQSLGYYGGAADFITAFNKYKANNDRKGFAAYMQARDAKRGKAISNHIPGYAIDIPRNTRVNAFLSKNGASVKGFSKFLDEPKNNCTHIEFSFLVCGQSNSGGGGALPADNAAAPSGNTISASVGKGGKNIKNDVMIIQTLLNKKGAKLTVDGICGNGTINAIASYQKSVMKIASPDGRVDVNGATWKSLSGGAAAPVAAAAPAAEEKSEEKPAASEADTASAENTAATPSESAAEGGGSESAAEGGSESAAEGGSEAAAEGGSEAAEEGGSEAAEEGGSEAAAEGGSEAAAEGGSEAAAEGGSEAAAEGGSESAAEGGSEAAATPAAAPAAASSSLSISASVGKGGKNIAADVKVIQQLLNKKGAKLAEDGICGTGTINAIGSYQKSVMKIASPDGRVDVNGATWKSLSGSASSSAAASSGTASNTPADNTNAPAPTAAQKQVLENAKAYDAYLKEAADKYGMKFAHLKAIMCVESNAKPEASSGAAFGLMQLTKETWGDVQKKFSELSSYGFSANWTKPRINILFGAAALKLKAKSMGVDPTDPNFPTLGVTAYNAGEGTVKKAITFAKEGGSKNPTADFLKEEYLKPAIKHYNLHKYYLTGGGKKSNKSGTEAEALNLKYKEITGYAPKVSTYLSMQA